MRRLAGLCGLVVALALAALPGSTAAQAPGADPAIRRALVAIQRNPREPRAHLRLGDAFIQKARETGDAAYFDRAARALRNALELHPRYSEAWRHLAFVHYARHDFAGAVRDASRAVALDPTDPHAYGVLGDAHLEIGEYGQAEAAYDEMMRRGGDLYSYARRSGLKSLKGDADGAIDDLTLAVADGQANGRPAESIAWAQWQLATEHFNQGRLELAEAGHRGALATYPGYYRALAGLGQVRAAQGHLAEAVALYRRAIEIIPQPDYVSALGDLLLESGELEEARRQYDLVEYIGRLSAANQVLYNRELATFYLDHDRKLEEALALARREIDVRRDVYAWDLLAWALLKNGQPEAARAASGEALRLGTRDARLFFHAGMIEKAAGNTTAAAAHLRRAVEANPYFHRRQVEEARRALRALGGELSSPSRATTHAD